MGPSHLLSSEPLLTFQFPSLLLLEAAGKNTVGRLDTLLTPKDEETSVAVKIAQPKRFGRSRSLSRMAILGPPFHSHFGLGVLDATAEGGFLKRKS